MAIQNSNIPLGFKIKITNITGLQFDADIKCSVKKRIANIVYLNEPPPDAVLLSYAGTKELTASTCLYIGDRSDKIYPNSKRNLETEFIYPKGPVGIPHKNILVTQKFARGTILDVPLYFKHVLNPTVELESIKILDKNFKEVSSDHYLIEYEREYDETLGYPVSPVVYTSLVVYNSLENNFNFSTGEYQVYYIQYRDTWNNVNTVLLNNDPAYREATIDDIWLATGGLAPWSKAYVLEVSDSGYYVQVPSIDNPKFAVKFTAESKIYTTYPVMEDDTSLWIPRIANGSYVWRYGDYSYLYELPEFNSQSFNPIEPYKLIDRAKCVKISDYLLKLAHEDINTGDFMKPFTLVIEYNDNVIYALTQDTNLIGTKYKNFDGNYVYYNNEVVEWTSSEILSIDKRSGIVQLSIQFKDYWNYYATYNYKEKFYELSSLNMNPVFNKEIHKQIKVLYIVPVSSPNHNTSSQTRSLNYLTIGASGLIEDISQDSAGGNDPQNFYTRLTDIDAVKTYGLIGLHYNWRSSTYLTDDCVLGASEIIPVESTNKFPKSGWIRIYDGTVWRYVKFDNITSTSIILSDDDDGDDGSLAAVPNPPITITYSSSSPKKIEIVNFIDEYSSISIRSILDEDSKFGGSSGLPNCYNQYFIIAELAINPPHGLHDATLLDIREEGGNLDPDKYTEAKLKQPESQWFADYIKYNGQPIPGNAVVVIKLPVSLLNTFTEDQIAGIIDNNIPFGVKPLIRYYGYTPNITYVGPGEIGGFGDEYFGDGEFGI
jgi:hypothetical protein